MPATSSGSVLRDHEVGAALHEAPHRLGRALADAAEHQLDAALGQIRILLRAGEREFAADDALVQQEPRMIDAPRA